MQEEKNKQVIREFTRIFKNEHNVDGVGHLFDTKNFIHHFRAPVPTGFEGLRRVGIMMNGAFPDVVVTEEDLVASGDRVVERSSAVATHKGSMMGEKPTNKRVAWSEIHIYRLKDGRICEHWAEIAMMELLQQIGVLPQLGESEGGVGRQAAIQHSVQIAAKPEAIYPLVSTADGFRKWWATDVTESGGAVDLGFFNRASVYRLRRQSDNPPAEVEWRCETGQEWTGTRIRFHLEAGESGTLLRFTHADWQTASDYFVSCNTAWGKLMYRLKAAAQGKAPGPLFSTAGMAY